LFELQLILLFWERLESPAAEEGVGLWQFQRRLGASQHVGARLVLQRSNALSASPIFQLLWRLQSRQRRPIIDMSDCPSLSGSPQEKFPRQAAGRLLLSCLHKLLRF